MASSSNASNFDATHQGIKLALYAQCAQQPPGTQFDQRDLLALNVIPKGGDQGHLLFECMQRLTNEGLFKLFTKDGRVIWQIIRKSDAAKYKTLNDEERLVFSYIESSGRDGIWTKTIKMRTNLHQTLINRALKLLESKNFIKPIKSVRWPARKYYMLASLQPSEDVTGGPWFTDGVLDEEFIHQTSAWAEKYIRGRSWVHISTKALGEKSTKLTQAQAEDARAQEMRKHGAKNKGGVMLPLPPGYKGYPTVPEITKELNASGISGVMMREVEMQTLLDVLCYDGRLMRVMDGDGYKTVRQSMAEEGAAVGNGLTEAPCGRCPVFNLCEEGGPVNARNCEYFQAWLEA